MQNCFSFFFKIRMCFSMILPRWYIIEMSSRSLSQWYMACHHSPPWNRQGKSAKSTELTIATSPVCLCVTGVCGRWVRPGQPRSSPQQNFFLIFFLKFLKNHLRSQNCPKNSEIFGVNSCIFKLFYKFFYFAKGFTKCF